MYLFAVYACLLVVHAGHALGSTISLPVDCLKEDLTLEGNSSVAFSVKVSIGTPPQNFSLIVDTGSSNMGVLGPNTAGLKPYFNSSLSSSYTLVTQNAFSVSYVQGYIELDRVRDDVSFCQFCPSQVAVIDQVEFGVITYSKAFFPQNSSYQGILGMAYKDLAMPSSDPITPFFDTFINRTGLPDVFSLQLCDVTVNTSSVLYNRAGQLTIGGTDSALVIGNTYETPIAKELYYGVMVTDIYVGGTKVALDCGYYNTPSPAIVDSATTYFTVPQEVHTAIIDLLPFSFSSETDRTNFFTGKDCLVFNEAGFNFSALPNIVVSVVLDGDATKEIDLEIFPWQYLRPIIGKYSNGSDVVCRTFGVRPRCSSSHGMVLGVTLMSGYVITFDRANKKIAFARSTCSDDGLHRSTLSKSSITAPHPRSSSSQCTPVSLDSCSSSSSSSTTVIIAAAVGGAVVLIVFIVILLIVSGVSFRSKNRVTPPSSPARVV